MEQKEKMNILHYWVKELSWVENNKRTDAHLKVVVDPFDEDGDPSENISNALLNCSKDDYIQFVESLCVERIDAFTVDAIGIVIDGDRFDTRVTIDADIHLSNVG